MGASCGKMSGVASVMLRGTHLFGRHFGRAATAAGVGMTADSGYGLRARGLRSRPGMTGQNLRAQERGNLQPDLAEIDTGPQTRFDRFLASPFSRYFDDICARILVELVESEIAVVVARGFRDRSAILDEANARALDAVDHAIRLYRQRAADKAFRVAPEIAVIDARASAQFRLHHFEILFAHNARHLLVLDLDRAHGAGRTGLLAAGLLPALVEQVSIERPDLRKLQLLVPPDVPVGAGLDQVLAPPRLLRIDQHDPVLALLHCVAGLRHARRIVAVIAHGRNVGDVDHRHLPALLLQDVDPFVAVLRHWRAIARPGVADIFVHDRECAQVTVRALGHVDDHVPLLHGVHLFVIAGLDPAIPTGDGKSVPIEITGSRRYAAAR